MSTTPTSLTITRLGDDIALTCREQVVRAFTLTQTAKQCTDCNYHRTNVVYLEMRPYYDYVPQQIIDGWRPFEFFIHRVLESVCQDCDFTFLDSWRKVGKFSMIPVKDYYFHDLFDDENALNWIALLSEPQDPAPYLNPHIHPRVAAAASPHHDVHFVDDRAFWERGGALARGTGSLVSYCLSALSHADYLLVQQTSDVVCTAPHVRSFVTGGRDVWLEPAQMPVNPALAGRVLSVPTKLAYLYTAATFTTTIEFFDPEKTSDHPGQHTVHGCNYNGVMSIIDAIEQSWDNEDYPERNVEWIEWTRAELISLDLYGF